MPQLSLQQARYLILDAQGLNHKRFRHAHETLEALAYVQIDAISVIERAHHHVFWSRNTQYQLSELNTLLDKRQAFEYWGHAASYLPMSDFRYYLPTMRNFVQNSRWAQKRLAQVQDLFPDILQRIEDEGPLRARDFQGARRKGGWWNWKPAKVALELLYWQGKIMVCQRQGFDKVYDLAERFAPQALVQAEPTREEVAEFCLRRALQAHAVMSFKELTRHLPLSNKVNLKQAIQRALKNQEISEVRIHTLDETYYALKDTLEKLPETLNWHSEPQILSPFDNIVIQRERLQNIFAFTYIFEAYVPKDKRQFGYFVLPVLDQGRFVARLDCKAIRHQQLLELQHWHWESGLRQKKAIEKRLNPVLQAFSEFNGCQSWAMSS